MIQEVRAERRQRAILEGRKVSGRPKEPDRWPGVARKVAVGQRVVVQDWKAARALELALRALGYRGEKRIVHAPDERAGLKSPYVVLNAGRPPLLVAMCNACRESRCDNCHRGLCKCAHEATLPYVGYPKLAGKVLCTSRTDPVTPGPIVLTPELDLLAVKSITAGQQRVGDLTVCVTSAMDYEVWRGRECVIVRAWEWLPRVGAEVRDSILAGRAQVMA